MGKFIVPALLTGMVLAAQPANAKPEPAALPDCAIGDISPTQSPFTTFGTFGCVGFQDKNVISGSPTDIAAQTSALAALGLIFAPGAFVFDGFTKLENLNGSHEVDFAGFLNGITYVGMHFGKGKGGPGNASAFYRFDAGTDLDKFYLSYNASSNVILYQTDYPAPPPPPPVVPEPASWALMLAGFAAVGYAMRRRRRVTASFS